MSLEKGYFHQAIQMFEKFLKSNPDDIAVNEKMALLLYQTEQFQESLPYFNKFRSLGGETKETLYSYGKALTHNQNFTDAEDVFLSLVRSHPDVYQVTVVQALVNLYIEQDKLVEASKFTSSLVKRGYEIPTHLIEQRQHIKSLMNKKS
jgi:tetratricopeptide (TPR) repeat protein